MAYKLTFKDLGRTKFSGSVTIKNITYDNLARAVRPYLRSEPDFEINKDETKGRVFAGWHFWEFDIKKITEAYDDKSGTNL